MPESIACNLCSTDSYRILSDKTSYLGLPEPLCMVRCQQCGLVYMSPRLTPDEHREQFVGSSFYETEYLPRAERMETLYPDTYELFERMLGRRGALLDVGCATGHFLRAGQQRGWNVTGIEVAPGLAQYARETFGLDVRVAGQVENAGLSAQTFDVVYVSHVLEHLHDPRNTLERLRPLLASDGLLVVQVPNEFEDLLYLLFGPWIKRRFERDGLFTDHLYFFTPRTIRRLIEEVGFEVQRVSTWDWRNQRNLLRGRRPGAGLVKAALFTIGGTMGRGPNIEVIARKA